VKQYKNSIKWKIEDIIQMPTTVPGLDKMPKKQIWNISPDFLEMGFTISTIDQFGKNIQPVTRDAFFSNTYGMKEPSKQIVFESTGNFFQTIIELPQKA
jgi:hypothetical protein